MFAKRTQIAIDMLMPTKVDGLWTCRCTGCDEVAPGGYDHRCDVRDSINWGDYNDHSCVIDASKVMA